MSAEEIALRTEKVPAFRKDVSTKWYRGDAKKRMRQFGKVDIPQEAFIAA